MESKFTSSDARKIIEFFSKEKDALYSMHLKSEFIEIKKKVKNLEHWNFDICNFYQILSSVTPFDVMSLWYMHAFHIFSLDVFISNVVADSILCHSFIKNVTIFCKIDSSKDPSVKFVQGGLFSYLVSRAFDNSYLEELKQICKNALQHILKEIFHAKTSESSERMMPLSILWNCENILLQNVQSFCLFFLQFFLQEQSLIKIEVFSIQKNCKKKEHPFHLSYLFDKVIKTLETTAIVQLLLEELVADENNLKGCIVVIDSFVRVRCGEYSELIEMNNLLMKKAFETKDPSKLQAVIVIIRQAAFSSDIAFPIAYKQFLHVQFSENLLLKNKDNFKIFVHVLVDLVPKENDLEVLKVCLEQQISVPSECEDFFSNYTLLLKTRIKDLQPIVKPDQIIDKLLCAFEETGKIPSYILETSLVQRYYFLNTFLPALLSPRVIPAIPDIKENFITALNKAGKIPAVFFHKYKSECAMKKEKILSVIGIHEDGK